jgi:hypothetical protein
VVEETAASGHVRGMRSGNRCNQPAIFAHAPPECIAASFVPIEFGKDNVIAAC